MLNKLKYKFYTFLYNTLKNLITFIWKIADIIQTKQRKALSKIIKFKSISNIENCEMVIEYSFCNSTPFEKVVHDPKTNIKLC